MYWNALAESCMHWRILVLALAKRPGQGSSPLVQPVHMTFILRDAQRFDFSIPDTVGVSVQFLLNLLMIPLLSPCCSTAVPLTMCDL
jgi:hypothetical protein